MRQAILKEWLKDRVIYPLNAFYVDIVHSDFNISIKDFSLNNIILHKIYSFLIYFLFVSPSKSGIQATVELTQLINSGFQTFLSLFSGPITLRRCEYCYIAASLIQRRWVCHAIVSFYYLFSYASFTPPQGATNRTHLQLSSSTANYLENRFIF